MKYKSLIFDFDYTLGDATEAIYAGFCHAFTTMGYPAPGLEAVRGTIGLVAVDGYSQLSGDRSEEGRHRFYQLFHSVAKRLQEEGHAKLFPGARELLTELKARNASTAVVSSKVEESLRAVLSATGILPLFDQIIGGGTVGSHKPDPEGLELAIRTLGVEKPAVLYCGDTVIDAQTAQNAGVDFCAVLNGTTPRDAFEGYPCVHIAPDLPELKSWLIKEGLV